MAGQVDGSLASGVGRAGYEDVLSAESDSLGGNSSEAITGAQLSVPGGLSGVRSQVSTIFAWSTALVRSRM
jgi:hypothetical protein